MSARGAAKPARTSPKSDPSASDATTSQDAFRKEAVAEVQEDAVAPDAIRVELAELAAGASGKAYAAARALHDDIAPLLVTAGLKLQLMQMDEAPARISEEPHAAADAAADADDTGPVDEVLELLNDAMEKVRRLSQDLHASPVDRMGLRLSLERLASQTKDLHLSYKAGARPEARIAGLLFEAASAAIGAARRAGASAIRVSVTGSAGLHVRVQDDGSFAGRRQALETMRLLSTPAGIVMKVDAAPGNKTGTIVSIRYASRRASSR